MKDWTKRFYNNVNSKKLKSMEELVTEIAAMHNFIRTGGEEAIPTRQYHHKDTKTLKSYAGEVEVGSAWRRKALLRREKEERERPG
jgi:hypothetical protein